MNATLLGLRDELFCDRTKCLGLRLGGDNPLGSKQRCCEIGHHETLVRGAAAESLRLAWSSWHGGSVPVLERQTALVKFQNDLIKRLLTEVGDVQ